LTLFLIFFSALGLTSVNAATIVGSMDQPGVWLFNAGTDTTPGGQPTDEIVNNAVAFNILLILGDVAGEVLGWASGPNDNDEGPRDTTLAAVVEGLEEIDDFGIVLNPSDPESNYDAGSGGWVELGNIGDIFPDGVVATGTIGPETAANPTEAEDALGGFEIFIFEDAELSGYTCVIETKSGATFTFELDDKQPGADPTTPQGADDTLCAIDLDSLAGFNPNDPVVSIMITDDGETMVADPLWPDTTLELDAVATRISVVELPGSISGHKWNDTSGDGIWDPGEPSLEGWTIYLSGDDSDSTTTDVSGYYEFIGLSPGSYTVSEGHLPNWYQTHPVSPSTYSITLGSDEHVTDKDFGNHKTIPPPSVGGEGRVINTGSNQTLPVLLAISLIGIAAFGLLKKREN
jgi:LPXTG-motif cell wall-anchored protein